MHLEKNIINSSIPFICLCFLIGQKEKTLASNSVYKNQSNSNSTNSLGAKLCGKVCWVVGVGVSTGRGETKDGYMMELAMTYYFCYFLDQNYCYSVHFTEEK